MISSECRHIYVSLVRYSHMWHKISTVVAQWLRQWANWWCRDWPKLLQLGPDLGVVMLDCSGALRLYRAHVLEKKRFSLFFWAFFLHYCLFPTQRRNHCTA